MDDLEIRKWYILSATAGIKELENRFCALSSLWQAHGEEPIDYFLPTCVEQTSVFGQPAMRRKKLLGNYVFVRDTYARVLEIKSAIPSLWLLPHPDRGQDARRFMTITDREMDVFKTIARAHANELPCYPIGAVDLDEGDKVKIVGGDFDGMCGTLQCSQGRNGGRVLMSVGNLFLVATPSISPQYIRILQFGKGNRHPYRKFEAHLPRVLQALSHLHGHCLGADKSAGLTTSDVAAMTVFVGRFAQLQPATVNIASQHATLMLMSYAALQDHEHADRWLLRCRALLPSVKSQTQQAWQLVFMYVATGDDTLRSRAAAIIDTWSIAPNDRKRSLIATTLHTFTRWYTPFHQTFSI